MQNIKRITIDIGNSSFKVNGEEIFDSRIKEVDINCIDHAEAIVHNGKAYAIGQGDYIHNNFKADKENLDVFILYAIGKFASKTDDEFNLILNLPINQLANKEQLKSRFEGEYFEYSINSPSKNIKKEERMIKINKVGVVAEGLASYYSLNDDELDSFITILDIGSKSVNYSTFTDIGVNDINKSNTLDFGIHDFYEDCIQHFKTIKHKTYTISDIDSRIKAKKIEIPKSIKVDFVKRIINSLQSKNFMDFDDYSIKGCGGGSLILQEELKEAFSDFTMLENPVFRNNIGTELIAENLGL